MITAWQDLFRLEKGTFKSVIHMLDVTRYGKKLYEEFKPYLPLINDIRNPSLKKRHWVKLTEICNINFDDTTIF